MDLEDFNHALLGKWWWKFATGTNWCGSTVIHFNYGGITHSGIFLPRLPNEGHSFGMESSAVYQLSGGVSHKLSGMDPLLFYGLTGGSTVKPMNIWPNFFRASQQTRGTVKYLFHLLTIHPMISVLEVLNVVTKINARSGEGGI